MVDTVVAPVAPAGIVSTKQLKKAKMSIDLDLEPILKPNTKRFVLFPVQYHEVCHNIYSRARLP